jgi:hypothetical protein
MWFQKEKRKEIILREQPFRSVLIIKEVHDLEDQKAKSGESFKITSNQGKTYKLRYCFKLSRARELERNVMKFPKAFPKFYGREGTYLLFDWLNEGKTFDTLGRPPNEDECYQIGKLMGEIHQLSETTDSKEMFDNFHKRIDFIEKSKTLDSKTVDLVRHKLEELRKKLKVDVVLDYKDAQAKNIMLDAKNNRVYFIDEDGLNRTAKGSGLDPLLKTIIKTPDQQRAFWKGYKEHHSNDYFDKDYAILCNILNRIFLIYRKIENKQPIDEWLTRGLEKL